MSEQSDSIAVVKPLTFWPRHRWPMKLKKARHCNLAIWPWDGNWKLRPSFSFVLGPYARCCMRAAGFIGNCEPVFSGLPWTGQNVRSPLCCAAHLVGMLCSGILLWVEHPSQGHFMVELDYGQNFSQNQPERAHRRRPHCACTALKNHDKIEPIH